MAKPSLRIPSEIPSQVSSAWLKCIVPPLLYAQPTDNPNELNYRNGLLCVPFMNPDIGGIRNFDNILFAWIAIFQHMVVQDWWVEACPSACSPLINKPGSLSLTFCSLSA